jgi:hypothetical protein
MYKIDVIVVSRDNIDELMDTLTSLINDKHKINKVIIVDDSKVNYERRIAGTFKKIFKIQYFFQKSDSIYSAFNVGVSQIDKDYIFINSGDWLIGSTFKNVEGPGILPSISVLNNIPKKVLSYNRFMKFFNHQSIIFDARFKEKFDERYQIAADLDFFIRYSKIFGVPQKIPLSSGLVCFSLGGISTSKKLQRDIEYLRIYGRNGLLLQFLCFFCLMIIKFFGMRYV